MEMITLKISGVPYTIKKTFRSLLLFEQMTNKSINDSSENLTDIIVLFYCIVKASNKNFEKTYDEFIDLIDEKPEILSEFSKYLLSLNEPSTEKKN